MKRLKVTAEKTQHRIFTGVHARGIEGTVGAEPEERIFNLIGSSVNLSEGSPDRLVQVYTLEIAAEQVFVPFVIHTDGISESEKAVRGTDYDIVDADGEIVTVDYFKVRANQIRGSLYIRTYTDEIDEPAKRFHLELVYSNDDATLDGLIGPNSAMTVSILDTNTPIMGFAAQASQVDEPASGTDVTHTVTVELSQAPAAQVTAVVSFGSTLGVHEANYTISDPNVTFEIGETSFDFDITIHGDSAYLGDYIIDLQLTDLTGDVDLAVENGSHSATVKESSVQAEWKVRFLELHNGLMQIREGDTNPIEIGVEFIDGVPNDSNVQVYWTLQEVNGSGVVLGQNITTSTPSPITILAGTTLSRIKLLAPDNGQVDQQRLFELRLSAVLGGSPAQPVHLSDEEADKLISGYLVDAETDVPTIGWANQTASVTEQGTIQVYLNLSQPAPNPITLNVSRTGIGADELSYIGDTAAVVIPQGVTSHIVAFSSPEDAEPEGPETATFTIEEGTGYLVDTDNDELEVTVTDFDAGTTIVEYRPSNLADHAGTFVSVCTGMPAIPASPGHSLMIDGLKADVFPIDKGRDQGGTSMAWEAVAFVPTAGGQSILQSDTGASYGPGYRTDDISGLKFILNTHNEGETNFTPHEVTVGEGLLIDVPKDGHYVRDEVYFLRPRNASEAGTIHEYCCQIMLFVTRRPDGIFVKFQFMNEAYDHESGWGHFNDTVERPELDGRVAFTTLTIEQAPGLHTQFPPVRQRTIQASSTFPKLISTDFSGRTHLIPPGRMWVCEFGLFRDGEGATYADPLFEMDGIGVAKAGPLAYDKYPWFGPEAAYVPKFGSGYRAPSQATGSAAVGQAAAAYYDRAKAAVRGTASLAGNYWEPSQNIGGSAYSWFEPGINEWSYDYGGFWVNLTLGYHQQANEMVAMKWHAMAIAQANPCGITNPNTGKQVTNGQLASTNTAAPGQQGKAPFAWYSFQPVNPWLGMPWFLPGSARPQNGVDGMCLRPKDRKWTVMPGSSSATVHESLKVESFGAPAWDTQSFTGSIGNAAYSFGITDPEHYVRFNTVYKALAWSRNCSWAKWMLKRSGIHMQRVYSQYPIQGIEGLAGSSTNQNNYYIPHILQVDMTWVLAELLETEPSRPNGDSEGWGGYQTPSEWHTDGLGRNTMRSRGHAHAWDTVAAMAAILDPQDPVMLETLSWNSLYLQTLSKIATDWGGLERGGIIIRDGVTVLPYYWYQNFPNDTNFWANAIPDGWTASQSWMGAWLAYRAFTAWRVFGESSDMGFYRKLAVNRAFATHREAPLGSRPADRTRGTAYDIYSDGSAGQADAPLTIPKEYGLIRAPGSNEHVDANNRHMCMLQAAAHAMHITGETDLRDEMIGYIKLFMGVPSGTIGQLITKLEEEASHVDITVPLNWWSPGNNADAIGLLQALQAQGVE